MAQQICTEFELNTNTSSATICKWCGKEKFMHEQIIMAQQTAVEWLFEQIGNGNITSEKTDCGYLITINNNCYEQAKQMQKEQIIKAFSAGQETPINHPTLPHYSREEYFNDTYDK